MARPPKTSLTNHSLLEAALEGLEAQKARIDQQISDVRRMLGGASGAGNGRRARKQTSAAGPPGPRRKLSAAARKRIAAAQKKRWANYRKTTPSEA